MACAASSITRTVKHHRSCVVESAPFNEQLLYERGYVDGRAEAEESYDDTWTPRGAFSEYERGWNDGYNGVAPRESPITLVISPAERDHHAALRQRSYELAIERKHIQ